MTARKVGARRGRPVEIPALVIVTILEALERPGACVGSIAKAYGVSRRYVRDLKFDQARRPDAGPPEPPAIEALATVTGELAGEALEIRELWKILSGR